MAAALDGLGDLRPVVLASAIAGFTFSASMLASMLRIEERRLSPALEAASDLGLITATGPLRAPVEFVFNDRRLHQIAYDTIPVRQRLTLHRAAAATEHRVPCAPGQMAVKPNEIARHHQLACNSRQSIRWLSKAAWHAIVRGDTTAAIDLLQDALNQGNPSSAPAALQRALLQLLGVQLALANGSGSNTVFETYLQSVAVADDTSSVAWGQQFRSLWLAQTCHAVKGEVRAALTIGNLLLGQLNQRAEAPESALGRRILCQRVQALSLMLGGQLKDANTLYDAVVQHYRPELHALLRFAYGSDQLALAHAHQAWVYAIMGHSLQSLASARLARRMTDDLEHLHTSAHVMGVLALAAFTTDAIEEAALIAREARTIATEGTYKYWLPWCDAILGACEARRSPRSGYALLETAMAQYRATDAAQLCPYIYAELAKAALDDNRPDRALEATHAGLALTQLNGCALYRPTLHHQRARALIVNGDHDQARMAFDAGYAEARRSGASRFADKIALDGMRLTRGQQLLLWQSRYHGGLQDPPPENRSVRDANRNHTTALV